ncbi:MAG: hypothetical protein GXY83_22100 [Rhodopirellula sp.]|nr:hypothetical protein [Rhodopirellula sp.]
MLETAEPTARLRLRPRPLGEAEDRQARNTSRTSRGGILARHILAAGLHVLPWIFVFAGILCRARTDRAGLVDHESNVPWELVPRVLDGQLARPQPSEQTAMTGLWNDRKRVVQVRPAGARYDVLLKGGFTAHLHQTDSDAPRRPYLAVLFEAQLRRTIEANDGRRIVSTLQFGNVKTAKLRTAVENIALDLGSSGTAALAGLDLDGTGRRSAAVPVRRVAEAILAAGVEEVIACPSSRASLEVDSLSGKSVRISEAAGEGVQWIQPVGCALTATERDLLFSFAALADWYPFLEEPSNCPGTGPIDGSCLTGFLALPWHAVGRGEAQVAAFGEHDAQRCVDVELSGGPLQLYTEHMSALYAPRGLLRYRAHDGFVEAATVDGPVSLGVFPKARLVFENRFRAAPVLSVRYVCRFDPPRTGPHDGARHVGQLVRRGTFAS